MLTDHVKPIKVERAPNLSLNNLERVGDFTSLVEWDISKLIIVAKEGEKIQKKLMQERTISANPYATATNSMISPIPTPTETIIPPGAESGIPPLLANSPGTPSGSDRPYTKLAGNPFLEQHTPESAKCAVPMAMALIAAIEFIGSILDEPGIWNAGNKFDRAAKNFFAYAGFHLDSTEMDVLRQAYRNGMVHNFMMQGIDVSIDYQSRFEEKEYLVFTQGDQTVLNVNKLEEIVSGVLKKLVL